MMLGCPKRIVATLREPCDHAAINLRILWISSSWS